MANSEELIWKKTLYIQLFKIYEKELLNIFEHIHPFWNNNLKTFWNRIHQLHLRICSEVENLAKDVCYTIKPEKEVEKIMKLKRKQQIEEELKKIKCKDKKVILYVMKKNKYSPFIHYLSFLKENLGLQFKKIEFIYWSEFEHTDKHKNKYVQPFSNGKSWLPFRWDSYNSIKHNKIQNYSKCTLWDLISSFSAFYILLNYLFYNYDNKIYCNWYYVNNILNFLQEGNTLKSEILKPTCVFINYPYNFFVEPSQQVINDSNINEINKALTSETNKCKSITIPQEGRFLEKESLYFCCFLITPMIYMKDYNIKTKINKFYKIRPFVYFVNNFRRNFTNSIIWQSDLSTSCEVYTWFSNDFDGLFAEINN